MDDTLATLEVLIRQQGTYFRRDFLASTPYNFDNNMYSTLACIIDRDCRSKMVGWCHQVTEFCQFSCDDIVEIAMSYLDRFLTTAVGRRTALINRSTYQLACMTCLYTAVKINEQVAMDSKLVSTLSRGAYSVEEIESMERTILVALDWRTTPPTTSSFVRQFVQLVPEEILREPLSMNWRENLYNCSIKNISSASYVEDYDKIVSVPPSEVAYVAFMNALSEFVDETAYLVDWLQLLRSTLSLFPSTQQNGMVCLFSSSPWNLQLCKESRSIEKILSNISNHKVLDVVQSCSHSSENRKEFETSKGSPRMVSSGYHQVLNRAQ